MTIEPRGLVLSTYTRNNNKSIEGSCRLQLLFDSEKN